MEEKAEFFRGANQIDDEDELMDELNELEALNIEEELNEVEIGAGHVASNKVNVPAAKNKAIVEEEDELKALERMMAL